MLVIVILERVMENFIPTRPEFLTKDWVLMVINQYRDIKQLSLLRLDIDKSFHFIREMPFSLT